MYKYKNLAQNKRKKQKQIYSSIQIISAKCDSLANNYNIKIIKMYETKTINKHFPSHISSVKGSLTNQFMLKSQGENWMQIHNQHQFIDVISLPQSLKMARLNCCNVASNTISGKSQYCFDWGCSIGIGSTNQLGTETHIDRVQIQNSIFMTNAVSVASSCYCNLSLNSGNQSYVNILKTNKNSKLKYYSISNIYNVAPFSNLIHDSTYLYFLTNSPQQNLISFDLQSQSFDLRLQLPEIQIETKLRCFLVPKFNQNQNGKSDLACVYGSQWLGLVDLRFNGLVALQKIYDSQNVFGLLHEGIPKIYYSQGCVLRQYDIRKGSSSRNPILTLQNSILDCGIINQNLTKFEDIQNSGIHIYKINSFS